MLNRPTTSTMAAVSLTFCPTILPGSSRAFSIAFCRLSLSRSRGRWHDRFGTCRTIIAGGMLYIGFPGFEDYMQPIGFIAPAGLPAPIAAKLDATIVATLDKPAMEARLRSLGAQVKHLGPTEYREWLSQDRARWSQLITSVNIKAE